MLLLLLCYSFHQFSSIQAPVFLNLYLHRGHSKSMSPQISLPPCHRLSPFTLTPLPPCHHPNSDKLFDPKVAAKSLNLHLTDHIRMPKSHRETTEKHKKTIFYVFKASDTVASKSEKLQITVN